MMNNRNKQAFTILEVLVAVAITGLVALVMYSSLYISVRATESSRNAIEPIAEACAIFECIRRDMGCVTRHGQIISADFIGTPKTGSQYDSDSIIFHCTRTTDNIEGGADVIKVEYVLEPQQIYAEYDIILNRNKSDNVLKRKITTNLLAPTTAQPETEIISRNVYSLCLKYYDGANWIDNWDSSQTDNSLPQAVEITLGMKNNTYSKIIILDCYQVRD